MGHHKGEEGRGCSDEKQGKIEESEQVPETPKLMWMERKRKGNALEKR